MVVGYLKKSEATFNGEKKSFTAGALCVPFLPTMEITLSKNKSDKKTDHSPDFFIYMNRKKGYNGPKSRVGALWTEKVDKQDSPRYGEGYMRGHIETPLVPGDRLYIAIFKAQPSFEGEELAYDYDILWSPALRKKDNNEQEPTETFIPNDYEITIDDEEIPF